MERGTKRKAAAALGSPATPSAQHLQTPASDRPSKRVRTPLTTETKAKHKAKNDTANVQKEARDFIQHLKRATDKAGRLVATVFLELPDPEDVPGYYELILLPISVETLEAKIERDGYTSLSDLEGDVKRMVANAKKFNESKSEIYEDAERIRKLTFNYMTRINPAYKNSSYTAVATAEPDTPQGYPGGAAAAAAKRKKNGATPAAAGPKRRESAATATPKPRDPSRSQSVAVAAQGVAADDSEFAGKTFQQAQEMILRDAIDYQVDELEIFTPFANLPPRSLTEYYQTIRQPTSLKGILKKVQGIKGRDSATGVTDFKNWDAFENEVAKIWINCRTFNEDGSDMYNLAQSFEDWFHERLAEARAAVPEPNQPTLKLNLNKSNATNIKLRLGQKDSPAPPAAASPAAQANGISVDQQALQRQRALVNAGANGHLPRPSSSLGPSGGRNASPPMPGAGVKAEVNGVNGTYSPAMPPPPTSQAHLPGGSPFPIPGAAQAIPQQQQPYNPYQSLTQPATGIDSKWRADGKGPDESLLPLLQITSHPAAPPPINPSIPSVLADPNSTPAKPLTFSITPHAQLAQQSITLNLPANHQHLTLTPKLHPALVAGQAYRIFVTSNGQRVTQNPNLDQSSKVQYDVRCGQGVSRVELEVVAVKASRKVAEEGGVNGVEGGGEGKRGEEWEREGVCLFVHVLRS